MVSLNRVFPKKRKRSKGPWNAKPHEESFLETCRREVEEQYAHTKLSSGSVGGCFGSILCSELHHGGKDCGGLHFTALAAKWGINVTILGELIWDHCKRLEPKVQVTHDKKAPICRRVKSSRSVRNGAVRRSR